MVSFPTSLDAFSNPAAATALNNGTTPHATQHSDANDALEALEAKVGISASTPVASSMLVGTSAGTSAWTTTPTIGATSWANANHAHAAANSGGQIGAGNLSGATLASGVTASSLTSVGVLASPHMTNAVVDSGGFTVSAGGARITAGNLGIGVAPIPEAGLFIQGSILSTQVTQYGAVIRPTASTSSTSGVIGLEVTPTTAAAAFTTATGVGLQVTDLTLGAGSAVTSLYGIRVLSQTRGGTNNYGVYIEAPSGGSTANIGLYNAGTTTLAGALTVSAGGARITAGNLGVNAAIDARRAVNVGNPASGADGVSTFGLYTTQTYGSTGGITALITAAYTDVALTVTAATTVSRRASLYVASTASTVNGTLTNNDGIYVATPSGGSTVRVIDTAAGGYLTTGGVWTDNPSFAALKRDITPVTRRETASLFDWFARNYRPVRYHYADHWIDEADPETGKMRRVLARYERDDVDYPHFGYLLDDLPQSVREIVCADVSGGISGKDERGLLLALVSECARRITVLEARLN